MAMMPQDGMSPNGVAHSPNVLSNQGLANAGTGLGGPQGQGGGPQPAPGPSLQAAPTAGGAATEEGIAQAAGQQPPSTQQPQGKMPQPGAPGFGLQGSIYVPGEGPVTQQVGPPQSFQPSVMTPQPAQPEQQGQLPPEPMFGDYGMTQMAALLGTDVNGNVVKRAMARTNMYVGYDPASIPLENDKSTAIELKTAQKAGSVAYRAVKAASALISAGGAIKASAIGVGPVLLAQQVGRYSAREASGEPKKGLYLTLQKSAQMDKFGAGGAAQAPPINVDGKYAQLDPTAVGERPYRWAVAQDSRGGAVDLSDVARTTKVDSTMAPGGTAASILKSSGKIHGVPRHGIMARSDSRTVKDCKTTDVSKYPKGHQYQGSKTKKVKKAELADLLSSPQPGEIPIPTDVGPASNLQPIGTDVVKKPPTTLEVRSKSPRGWLLPAALGLGAGGLGLGYLAGRKKKEKEAKIAAPVQPGPAGVDPNAKKEQEQEQEQEAELQPPKTTGGKEILHDLFAKTGIDENLLRPYRERLQGDQQRLDPQSQYDLRMSQVPGYTAPEPQYVAEEPGGAYFGAGSPQPENDSFTIPPPQSLDTPVVAESDGINNDIPQSAKQLGEAIRPSMPALVRGMQPLDDPQRTMGDPAAQAGGIAGSSAWNPNRVPPSIDWAQSGPMYVKPAPAPAAPPKPAPSRPKFVYPDFVRNQPDPEPAPAAPPEPSPFGPMYAKPDPEPAPAKPAPAPAKPEPSPFGPMYAKPDPEPAPAAPPGPEPGTPEYYEKYPHGIGDGPPAPAEKLPIGPMHVNPEPSPPERPQFGPMHVNPSRTPSLAIPGEPEPGTPEYYEKYPQGGPAEGVRPGSAPPASHSARRSKADAIARSRWMARMQYYKRRGNEYNRRAGIAGRRGNTRVQGLAGNKGQRYLDRRERAMQTGYDPDVGMRPSSNGSLGNGPTSQPLASTGAGPKIDASVPAAPKMASVDTPFELTAFAGGFLKGCAGAGLTGEQVIKCAAAAAKGSCELEQELQCLLSKEGREWLEKDAIWGALAKVPGLLAKAPRLFTKAPKLLTKAPKLLTKAPKLLTKAPGVARAGRAAAGVGKTTGSIASKLTPGFLRTGAPKLLPEAGAKFFGAGGAARTAARNAWRSGPGHIVRGTGVGYMGGSAIDAVRSMAGYEDDWHMRGNLAALGGLSRIPGLARAAGRGTGGAWLSKTVGNPGSMAGTGLINKAMSKAPYVAAGAPLARKVVDNMRADQTNKALATIDKAIPELAQKHINQAGASMFGQDTWSLVQSVAQAFKGAGGGLKGIGAALSAGWEGLPPQARTWLMGGGLALLAGGGLALAGRPGLGAAAGVAGLGAGAYGVLGQPGGWRSLVSPDVLSELNSGRGHLFQQITAKPEYLGTMQDGTPGAKYDLIKMLLQQQAGGQNELQRASG